MPTNQSLRLYQWGLEATPGVGVPATSKILVPEITIEPAGRVQRPRMARGLLVQHPGDEIVDQHATTLTPSGPIVTEQFQHILGTALDTIPSPTGAGAAKLWTFTRAPKVVPGLDTFTVQRRLTDGTNNVQNVFNYIGARSLNITAAGDSLVSFSADWFARKVAGTAFSAGLDFPTPAITLPFAQAEIFFDATWATIGNTKLVGQWVGADWTFTTGWLPQMTGDGRDTLDFSTHVLDGSIVNTTLTVRLLVESTIMNAQKAAAEAQSLQAIRMLFTGAETAESGQNHEVQVDGLYRLDSETVLAVGVENGQDLVELSFVGATDETNFLEIAVQNEAATLV